MQRALRSRSRGVTLFDGLLLLTLVATAVLVALPTLHIDSIVAAEDEVGREILDLGERAEAARAAALRDLDGDGQGEAPPLSDVFGSRSVQFQPSPGGAAWSRGGYWFTLLTPGRGGLPAPPNDDPTMADYAEVAYLLVAWPVEPGRSGMRAYLWTPTDGLLRHVVDGYPYGGADRPPQPRESLVVVGTDGLRARRVFVPETDAPWRPPRDTIQPR